MAKTISNKKRNEARRRRNNLTVILIIAAFAIVVVGMIIIHSQMVRWMSLCRISRPNQQCRRITRPSVESRQQG